MSEKKRINEIAKATGFSNQQLVAKAQEMGMDVKSHSSSILESEEKRLLDGMKGIAPSASAPSKKAAPKAAAKEVVKEDPKEKPLTFQGKAVVIDPAILARANAVKKAEETAVKEESPESKAEVPAPKEPAKTPSSEIASQPVSQVSEKTSEKAPEKVKSVEKKPEKAAEKIVDKAPEKAADKTFEKNSGKMPEKKAEKASEKTHEKSSEKNHEKKTVLPEKKQEAPVVPSKEFAPKRPVLNIKVVKRAEDIVRKPVVKKESVGGGRHQRPRNGQPNGQANGQGYRQGNGQSRRPAGNGGRSSAGGRSTEKQTTEKPRYVSFDNTPMDGKSSRNRSTAKRGNNQRGESKYNDGGRPGGPLHVNDNRNQVRNARNANWNNIKKNRKSAMSPKMERKFVELPESLEYTEGMTVADLAKKLHRETAELVKKLFMMGVMATQNQSLDGETIELLLIDYGVTPEKHVVVDNADIERLFVEEGYLDESRMVERPPVVTIMGHVDHGKTTLLDHLRNSRVSEGEAGGITQHIGAYQLEVKGKKITFLDTPGHEAFTSMRARGASVTDVTILVVAADDGVMPQTIEAINHSKAAGVPIIVAINKIDKDGANPQRVIQELAEHNVMPTEWGGESEFVQISAKFDRNIDALLDTILIVAEMQELKADPTVRAIGTVIEARLDKGKGAIATLLVQQGTLHQQDPIVAGNTFGRVRAMVNDLGRRQKIAGPSSAVEITGLNEAPQAGDHFAVFEDEKSARAAGEERFKRAQLVLRQSTRRVSLENLFDTLKEGQIKTVSIIIKADVQGTAEALAASLQKIEVEGVKIDIVHAAVGAINESDISLAAASNAIIIGFNVRPMGQAREEAEREGVEIRLHSIIYKVIEEVEEAMRGMLEPEYTEEIVGEASVRELFNVSKVGTIAGFMVTSGKVLRDGHIRVIRDGVVLHDGLIASLKHLKDDVKEVGNAQEGGLMIEDFNEMAIDDTLEIYEMVEVKP